MMQLYGPDSWRSWAAACVAGLIQIPVLFSLKVMGVVFVGLLDEWQLSRHEASWPLTLFLVSSQMLTPVFPLIRRMLSAPVVLMLACIASAATLMLSYFAKDVVHISVILAFHGFAIAAIYIFSAFLLMQHFKTKRTAAFALASTISAGVTIFAPNAMQILVTSFGLRQSLLIVGTAGLVMFPLSKLLQTPEWYLDKEDNKLAKSDVNGSPNNNVEAEDLLKAQKGDECDWAKRPLVVRCVIECIDSLRQECGFMLTSRFFMHVVSITVTYNAMNIFLLHSFDHAMDIDIPKEAALYVIPAYSCGDLLGRIFVGMAIDAKLVSWQSVLAISYTSEAVCLITLVTFSTRTLLIVLSFVIGCTAGSKVVLVPVQLVNDFGLPRLIACNGAALFICGCVGVLRPWLVGLFRDGRGSYNGLFVVVALFCALCSAYWTTRTLRPDASRSCTAGEDDDDDSGAASAIDNNNKGKVDDRSPRSDEAKRGDRKQKPQLKANIEAPLQLENRTNGDRPDCNQSA